MPEKKKINNIVKMEEKLKLLKPVFKKYGVVFAYLFGSQARGRTGKLSDIDIAVYFKPLISPQQRQKMRFQIEEKAEKKLALSDAVDVVPLNEAQPLLEREIVYNGKVIYSVDESARTHYEARAISRWLDWKYYEDKLNRAIMEEMGKPIKAYGK